VLPGGVSPANRMAVHPFTFASPAWSGGNRFSPRKFRRVLAAVLLAPLFFSIGRGASASDVPAGEPIIELPKIVVTDSRDLPPPESWRYAEIPGFEILTNASERETQKLLREFRLFNIAIDVVWRGIQPRRSVPISLIICGRGGKFDAFIPAEDNRTGAARASLFLHDREQAAIVLDFEASTVNVAAAATDAAAEAGAAATAMTTTVGDGATEDTDPATGADPGAVRVDHYRQLYREYLRYLMSRSDPPMPAWFEEGLAQLFMGMSFDRRTIKFAQLSDSNEKGEEHDFNQALQQRALIPLQEFFSVERNSATATNPVGSTWAKQAQAFVHLGLYGDGQKYQKGFVTFLLRLQKEPPSEALFKECFKMSYKDMLITMRGYQTFTAYKSMEWRLPKGQMIPEPEKVVLREATQAEIGRIKGDALRLAGHPDTAHMTLSAPYVRGERDPRLLAALGLEESMSGHPARALPFLEAATKEKVVRPRAYLELARLRSETARAAVGPEGKLSTDQLVAVLEPLFVARGQPPPMPEVYALMAKTWLQSVTSPKHENFDVVLEGVRLFPRDGELVFEAAALAAKNHFAEAAALAELGRKISRDPAEQNRFELLSAALKRDTGTPNPSP
jgi:hypothetical protein